MVYKLQDKNKFKINTQLLNLQNIMPQEIFCAWTLNEIVNTYCPKTKSHVEFISENEKELLDLLITLNIESNIIKSTILQFIED